jgi:hypothetical protein
MRADPRPRPVPYGRVEAPRPKAERGTEMGFWRKALNWFRGEGGGWRRL